MDTKALRQKILDLAIRGKLVPQDPNDEPASVLLERIRAEKQQMVKDGTLKPKDIKNDSVIFKAEDNLHYEKFADGTVKCIEDEIPFDVPEGWAWSRLGNITDTIQYGLSNSAESTGTHRLLRITDIQDGKVNWDTVPFTKTNEPDKYTLHINDIVFARTGATVGKSFLITELPYESVYASYLIRIRLIGNISPQYIYQFFNSLCYWEQITGKAIGVGQPNCNGTALKELFIPLPPLNEQKQIVPTAESLLKYADVISSEKEQLANLIFSAKSKILDLAIRGKLVPQDPNDEPASVLLERIRAEKEELIKQGKIKRDKKESVIFKGEDNSYYETIGSSTTTIYDEIPFDLPNGWIYMRLQSFVQFIGGAQPPKSTFEYKPSAENIRLIQIRDYKTDNFITYIPKDKARRFCSATDVMIGRYGPPLFQILRGLDGAYNVALMKAVADNKLMLNDYLYYLLQDSGLLHLLESLSDRTCGQDGINMFELNRYIVGIPPIPEQKRIIKSIESCFTQLNKIAEALA